MKGNILTRRISKPGKERKCFNHYIFNKWVSAEGNS